MLSSTRRCEGFLQSEMIKQMDGSEGLGAGRRVARATGNVIEA